MKYHPNPKKCLSSPILQSPQPSDSKPQPYGHESHFENGDFDHHLNPESDTPSFQADEGVAIAREGLAK
jgi:hypothetical protein